MTHSGLPPEGAVDTPYKARGESTRPHQSSSDRETKMATSTVLALAVAAVLLVAVQADTACQRARATDQKSSNPYVIHECDQDGHYKAKQQTVGTPHWYWCYSDDGDVLLGPSRKIQACACPSEKERVKRNNRTNKKNDAEPECENTGLFKKQQADNSHKWCVNPNTGAVTKNKVPKSESLACQ